MNAFGLPHFESMGVLRWPILWAVTTGLISMLYWFGAFARPLRRWRWIHVPGAAFAAAAWLAMSGVFSWYVGNFGHYDKTYGSLGAIVGFLTWIWVSLMVVLLGAELNSGDRRVGRPARIRALAHQARAGPRLVALNGRISSGWTPRRLRRPAAAHRRPRRSFAAPARRRRWDRP